MCVAFPSLAPICAGSCNYAEGKCSCEPGFVGPSCDIACPIHQDNVCNLHGKCSATGKCECEKDYRGTKCEKACPKSGVNGLICHGKGTCEVWLPCNPALSLNFR